MERNKNKKKHVVLVIVCNRDIEVNYYSSYEEAYESMRNELSQVVGIPLWNLKRHEADYYGFYDNEAWANAPDGNMWDWKIA